MAEDGSSGPRAPEPAHDDSHEGDRHEAPRGRGASRPKGDGGAKGKGKAKVRAAQGKGPSQAKVQLFLTTQTCQTSPSAALGQV